MNGPTESDVASLSVMRRRILSLIPDDKWVTPIEVSHAMARVENVHITLSDLMKTCHSLSKQGFMQKRTKGANTWLKRVPVVKEIPKLSQPEKTQEIVKVSKLWKVDILSRISTIEDKLLELTEEVSVVLRDAANEIKSLRSIDKQELERLRDVEKRFQSFKEILRDG